MTTDEWTPRAPFCPECGFSALVGHGDECPRAEPRQAERLPCTNTVRDRSSEERACGLPLGHRGKCLPDRTRGRH